MSELIIALLAFGMALYIAYPLYSRKDSVIEERDLDPLLVEKRNLLEAIKDAEFDFHAGKLSQKDYSSHRASLEKKLSDVLQESKKSVKQGKKEGA